MSNYQYGFPAMNLYHGAVWGPGAHTSGGFPQDSYSDVNHTVCVTNLAFDTSPCDVWNLFRHAGHIVSLKIDYLSSRDRREQVTAIISYAHSGEARSALRFGGRKLHGKTIHVSPYQPLHGM